MDDAQSSQVSNPTDSAVADNGVVPVAVESAGESNVVKSSVAKNVNQFSENSESVLDVDFNLVCPSVSDNSSVASLIDEIKCDETLAHIRGLADKCMNGYAWEDNGILVHKSVDELNNVCVRIVLPLPKRAKALKLAHENTVHIGVRGMRRVLGARFVWPGIHGDTVKFVKSCDVCLRMNQAGNKKALMVERKILTVPFESVAVDLVGPLPKGKRGAKYMFTYICLASRWPEAIPMP